MDLVGKPEGKKPLGRPWRIWEDNIVMDLGIWRHGLDRSDLDRDRWGGGCYECGNEPSGSIKCGEFLD